MNWKKLIKGIGVGVGILGGLGLLGYIGFAFYLRFQLSNEQRSYFNCKLTGKETAITSCDGRNNWKQVSEQEAHFTSSDKFKSAYIPFSGNETIINLNKNLKASYDFWIVYDNYGMLELQHVDQEEIYDEIPKYEKKVFEKKLNKNFFWLENNEKKQIKIKTKGPFNHNSQFGPLGTKLDYFLMKGYNPQGVIVLFFTSDVKQEVRASIN